MDAREVAAAVVEVVTANMYSQLAPMMARRGVDPTAFWLIPYGGAGPVQAALLAQELGMTRVVIPSAPGTLCALGSLLADVRQDFVFTVGKSLDGFPDEAINKVLFALEAQARSWMTSESLPTTAISIERSADLRYKGQSFNLSVPLAAGAISHQALSENLGLIHQRVYGHAGEGTTEVIALRLTIIGTTAKPELKFTSPATTGQHERSERQVWLFGERTPVAVFDRSALSAGASIAGPAIIEQYDATTLVPPGWSSRIGTSGCLILESR
jgi:N-methylhydantoinase A